MRPSQRSESQLREISIERNYTKYAEGSVLVRFGGTIVLCTASVIPGVPRFLRGRNKGWITAEYGMLPRSTHTRIQREAAIGKQGGRTQEIQRLIGRSLRNMVDLKSLGENTITLDCDVIQADGGTRTACITAASVALCDAVRCMVNKKVISKMPTINRIAAVSVGLYKGQAVLDLDYHEDSDAECDMNVVMNESGQFIEVQGSAEGRPFSEDELAQMLTLAKDGLKTLLDIQAKALNTD